MNLTEALSFISQTSWMGSRLGLSRMTELMRRLGDPQKELKFIHVAGTNGKGSTCAMLHSILNAAGYRTGLYTSPHLARVNERMKINGNDITDDELIAAAERVKSAVDDMNEQPTEFEITTAMALLYFKVRVCNIVVLEVGLGGRLDATNVIPAPEVAVLCNIGLEHTEILGDTKAKIATEKAGIIKAGCTAVCYGGDSEVEDVFESICADRDVALTKTELSAVKPIASSLDGQVFSWRGFENLRLPLLGKHQLKNAALALETVVLLRQKGWQISDEAIRNGFSATVWPARLEVLCREPLFILDGAHNPQCAGALADALAEYLPEGGITCLTGVLSDKDYPEMIRQILPFASGFVCLTPDSPRALSAADLTAYLQSIGVKAQAANSVADGVPAAIKAASGKPVVCFGSLYLAGAVKEGFRKYRRNLQRKAGIEARNRLTVDEWEKYSLSIADAILASPEFESAKTIMSYRAVKGEVSLEHFNTEAVRRGKRVAYPLCVSKAEMKALLPRSDDAWVPGVFGIMEPSCELSDEVAPEDIDLVLCPCSAFDVSCNRVGMGGGYYDRYLPMCESAKITAVAFEAQRLPQVLTEAWDVRMEKIYTEVHCY